MSSPADATHLIGFLRATPLFQGLDEDDLAQLVAQMRPLDVDAGQQLIARGTPGQDMYVVEEGTLEARVIDQGRPRRLGLLGPGDVLGEMSVLRGVPRTADVVARSRCRLWVLSAAALRAAIAESPGLGDRLQEVMRRRDVANALRALQ